MLQGSLIIAAFLIIAGLMMSKKLPTLVALPLLAIVICVIAGVPAIGVNAEGKAIGWIQTVLEDGTSRMMGAVMAGVFGSWLGQLMNRTGVTETVIKKSAELGGDHPLIITLVMVVAVAMLFTTLGGLGSVIMVGSVVLPILISAGIPAASAACFFLMAFTTGLTFNISNWTMYSGIFGLNLEVIKSLEIYLLITTIVATLVMILVEFKRNGIKFSFSAPVAENTDTDIGTPKLAGVRGALSMLTPLIPILMVAVFKAIPHSAKVWKM